jgi:outer membrane protein assembly factor BamB
LFGAIGGVAAAGAAVGAWQLSGSSPGTAGSKGRAAAGAHRLLWSKRVPRPVQQIALAATDVYLALEGGAVLALTASSGQQRWYAGSASTLELAAGAGAVCWTDRGSVTAVSVSSGAKLWSKSGDVLPQVLTVADDLVAYGTASAVTVASWTSGAIQQVLPAANPTAVALADNVVFAAVDGTRITATQVSGGQLWSIGGMTGLSTTALTVAGSVLAGCGTVGAGLSVAFALDVSSGRELWQDTFGSAYNTYNAISVDSDAAVYGGNPGGSSSIGQIIKRNPRTGALGWTANIDLALGAGPLLVGTTILAGEGANVLALDSTSGDQLWQQTVDGNVTGIAVAAGGTRRPAMALAILAVAALLLAARATAPAAAGLAVLAWLFYSGFIAGRHANLTPRHHSRPSQLTAPPSRPAYCDVRNYLGFGVLDLGAAVMAADKPRQGNTGRTWPRMTAGWTASAREARTRATVTRQGDQGAGICAFTLAPPPVSAKVSPCSARVIAGSNVAPM